MGWQVHRADDSALYLCHPFTFQLLLIFRHLSVGPILLSVGP